jgi:hypothetical protein
MERAKAINKIKNKVEIFDFNFCGLNVLVLKLIGEL